MTPYHQSLGNNHAPIPWHAQQRCSGEGFVMHSIRSGFLHTWGVALWTLDGLSA